MVPPAALMAVLVAFTADDSAFAADDVPDLRSSHVTAVRNSGPIHQKRAFRPILPITSLTQAVVNQVSQPVDQTSEAFANEALEPPITFFGKTKPEVRIEPPSVPSSVEQMEPQTLDYGYIETNPAAPALSIAPPPISEKEANSEPQPKPKSKVESLTEGKSSSRSSASSGYSKSTGFNRGRSSSGPACRT